MSNPDSVEDVSTDERIEIIDEVDLDEDEMIDATYWLCCLIVS
ncbi:hypothetical protein MtrunA17_Chr8g0361831 [Medicago truncatula]|uniref:Uncharacterized protein n=1 Tax=Medicago truncatula TaxID=3880 RepID=A0A396GIU1_MEDTR|nr:hypothetical protein MtrunA17_Chr8g0361831 [Medicago truncatula]